MKKFESKSGEISYETLGSGPRNFLLVHNASSSHQIMGHTASHYAKKGRVLAPDLLGHGLSQAPKIDYSLEVFAESLIELCKFEKADQIVFIGLNHGANIGIMMAQLAPMLISHLVLIEPPIFMEPWVVKLVEDLVKEYENPKGNWAQDTVNALLVKASDVDREIALKSFEKTPSHVKISTYKQLLAWDKAHTFKFAIPTLLIQTTKAFCSEENAKTVFSQLQLGRVVGSGPWPNLEVPAQTHTMIDRFLELF